MNSGHLKTVSEICEETGVTRKTLFYYDRIGLLTPAVRSGPQNHKKYSQENTARLKQILECRKAGLTIREITDYLDLREEERKEFLTKVMLRLQRQQNETEAQIIFLTSMIQAL
ncbi:MAG: MerR family transcriptional regulator [Solobacterium sp.]|nr:MerR family transcriptional regulator [Solobacterium sp.]